MFDRLLIMVAIIHPLTEIVRSQYLLLNQWLNPSSKSGGGLSGILGR